MALWCALGSSSSFQCSAVGPPRVSPGLHSTTACLLPGPHCLGLTGWLCVGLSVPTELIPRTCHVFFVPRAGDPVLLILPQPASLLRCSCLGSGHLFFLPCCLLIAQDRDWGFIPHRLALPLRLPLPCTSPQYAEGPLPHFHLWHSSFLLCGARNTW